jgi:hypothetical protein
MPFFSRSDRPDRAPRRRREDGDRDGRLSFDAIAFEFVPAGEDVGLLRLDGAWVAEPEQAVPGPIEVEILRDGLSVRLKVLPDPSAPEALAAPEGVEWRGAFMANAELADDPRSDFALVAGGEVVAGLPRPGDLTLDTGYVEAVDEDEAPAAEAAGALADPDGDDSEATPLSELLAELERVAALEDGEAAVRPLEIDTEDVVAEHVAAREAAEASVIDLRSGLEHERQRHQAAESELRAELGEARRELESTSAEVERARAELEGAGAHHESRAHDLESQIDALRLDGERQAERDRHAEELERTLAATRAQLEQAQKELDIERRRASTMEEEMRVQGSIERQLRKALAGQEAGQAAAEADATRREHLGERGRDPQADGRDDSGRSYEVEEDFFSRIERAKRLSETSG